MQSILVSDTNVPRPLLQKETRSDETTPQLKGKSVVIVEDEGITQMQLRKILLREGLQIVGAATSGPEGVEIALRERPDLVLMDIRMPGEYDGLEAARRILEASNPCVVMLTAFSDEDYREQAQQLGACGYIIKPINRDILLPQLESAYNKRTAQ